MITPKKRSKLSGLYKGVFLNLKEKGSRKYKISLRIDIDGKHPLNVISGDISSIVDTGERYLSSFRFKSVEKNDMPEKHIVIIGKHGEFDPINGFFSNLKIILSTSSHSKTAQVEWLNELGIKIKCVCKLVSPYFRRVRIIHDYEEEVVRFVPYETNELDSPSPMRNCPISIIGAFSEAGIKLAVNKKRDVLPHPERIPRGGLAWTVNELMEVMNKRFPINMRVSSISIWLLSADEYVISSFKGLGVPDKDKHRRGCAVFQSATGWETPEEKRMRLFIYIHELGHCLNLKHPWENPDELQGYATLSWMNYPWRYYLSEKEKGETYFWKNFSFQFSNSELLHLRHAFRKDIV